MNQTNVVDSGAKAGWCHGHEHAPPVNVSMSKLLPRSIPDPFKVNFYRY